MEKESQKILFDYVHKMNIPYMKCLAQSEIKVTCHGNKGAKNIYYECTWV